MKTLIISKLIFIFLFIPSIVFGEEVCLKIEGCSLDKKGRCIDCVWLDDKKDKEVETLVVSNSECPNYFELHHGGKTCEIQRNRCDSNKFPTLCDKDFRGCKEIEIKYNKRFERNHGKIICG